MQNILVTVPQKIFFTLSTERADGIRIKGMINVSDKEGECHKEKKIKRQTPDVSGKRMKKQREGKKKGGGKEEKIFFYSYSHQRFFFLFLLRLPSFPRPLRFLSRFIQLARKDCKAADGKGKRENYSRLFLTLTRINAKERVRKKNVDRQEVFK